MKPILFIICLVSIIFAEESATSIRIFTGTKTFVDLNKGFSKNYSDTTIFIYYGNRFAHITKTIASTYLVMETASTFNLDDNKIFVVPTKSETGNEYLFVVDLAKNKIITYSSKEGFIVEYDVFKVNTD